MQAAALKAGFSQINQTSFISSSLLSSLDYSGGNGYAIDWFSSDSGPGSGPTAQVPLRRQRGHLLRTTSISQPQGARRERQAGHPIRRYGQSRKRCQTEGECVT